MHTLSAIKRIKSLTLFLVCLFLLYGQVSLFAQDLVDPAAQTLTRGKMWIASYESGDVLPGSFGCKVAYPGYYSKDTAPNNFYKPGIRIIAKKADEDLVADMGYLSAAKTWFALSGKQNTLVKNYNFVNALDKPEEYMSGEAITVDPNTTDDSYPIIYQAKTERAAWSLPKYDDFVITRLTVINRDTEALNDLYLMLYGVIAPTYDGWQLGFENDTEYMWDDDIGTFIFYDDTAWPFGAASPVQYSIEPGITTGDRGDPGNIREVGSIDRRLYSPQAVAEGFIDCTPNRDGAKKYWFEIRNSATDEAGFSIDTAPQNEEVNWQGADYNYLLNIITHEAPKMSWREAHDLGLEGAGNTYERTPNVFIGIGPYDIAPGDSIEAVWVTCGGNMDDKVSMKGGLAATQQLPQASIDNLKQNWAAAVQLYEGWKTTGNWNSAITAYPPPTAGSAPLVGNPDELEVSVYSEAGVGQGFQIAWIPVPDDYLDPLKGVNDLAGYKIYKSEIAIEGPWDLVADISKSEAASMIKDGRIVYTLESEPGIPSRFAVTSYDSDGLESGMTAYSFYSVAAPRSPSNKLSDVMVVPNPFRQVSGLLDPGEEKRLSFVNIPSQCTIRVYTTAGELVQTIQHDGYGEETWGSNTNDDYMLTQFAMNVMPGVYFFHIESHVAGHEGESATGKFMIIK